MPAASSAFSRAFRCLPGTWDSEWTLLKLSLGLGRTSDPKNGMSLSSALNTFDIVRHPSSMAALMSVVLTLDTFTMTLPR